MKILKNRFFIFILGGILFSSITAFAVTTISADKVTYTKSDGTVTNVNNVLDDLYNRYPNLHGALSDLKSGNNTIMNNTKDTLYVAIFGYTSVSNSSQILATRTQIDSLTGADSEEMFYRYTSANNEPYAIRVYKLTNCKENVSVTAKTHANYTGQIIFFY